MRLALIRGNYNPAGGAERFLDGIMAQLEKRDVDITLITRRWQAEHSARRVIACNHFSVGRYWRDRAFVHCVQSHLHREKFDLVQSHERIPGCHIYRAGDGVHATWLALRTKDDGLKGKLASMAPYHHFILQQEEEMFRDPHLLAVVCNSRMVMNDIQARFALPSQKLHLIPNGVDQARFCPGLATEFRSSQRILHGIAEEAVVLLHVGSGFARKGLKRTLVAMASLPKSGPPVHLLVVGDDRHSLRYQHHAQKLGLAKRVHFLGVQLDVRPWYGTADVFVLPTLYDPLPNAALEALGSGLPVITTHTCGAAEYVRSGINGWVMQPLDQEALNGYLEIAVTAGVAAGMREAARASVKPLTLATMTRQFMELYDLLRNA